MIPHSLLESVRALFTPWFVRGRTPEVDFCKPPVLTDTVYPVSRYRLIPRGRPDWYRKGHSASMPIPQTKWWNVTMVMRERNQRFRAS